ncbi:cobalt-zinc-cadmium resistance protein CzcB [bacterium BMS3Bbin11]|nr:cobalt-zinc-cadmium resistance protein CzcB [bacterium BMS3Bbin11]
MIMPIKPLHVALLISMATMTYAFTVESNPTNTSSASPAHEEQGHDKGGEHEESATVQLTPEQLKTAGIEVTRLALGNVAGILTAPGEIMLNDYRTVKITPRIAAQIIERHARLGDIVEQGQPLVTLSSVEMAQAEGELLVADREWRRVKSLGRKVVSEKRYTEARVSRDQTSAKVRAYGMSHDEITNLLDTKNKIAADGTFSLIATLKGRVLVDDFVIGERVEPGRELMVIADESVMWVEARVRPADAARISSGNPATIQVGNRIFQAKVSQIHHTLDETTRTLAVRLDVENDDDQLHPGMFVNVRIQTNTVIRALSVPESAVLRSPDGDWQVLVQQDEPGEFKAVEIELKYVSDGKAIISGIEPGTPVVTQGAFFVQSELAKSGFEIHNH